jgi:hypothetical protein
VSKVIMLILFLVSIEEASSITLDWYEGALVLKHDEVLKGQISVNLVYDIALFKSGDRLLVFPAHKIESIHYYDPKAKVNRKFTSIQEKVNAFTAHYLYEIVLVGEISVLRKRISLLVDLEDNRGSYRYFARVGEENLELHQFKSRIFPYLNKTCDSLKEYIRENRLELNNRMHAIQIIDYYNNEIRSETSIVPVGQTTD